MRGNEERFGDDVDRGLLLRFPNYELERVVGEGDLGGGSFH